MIPNGLNDIGRKDGNREMSKFLSQILNKPRAAARRFRDETSGVAAIEFCFIAPLLITLWLGTMEISQGIEVNKKVGRSASVIGDLIAQKQDYTVTTIDDILRIGASVLLPYDRDAPIITVTEISINAGLVATVNWSRRGEENSFYRPFAPGSSVAVPANLLIADTHLVKVETRLEYLPITSWSIRRNKSGGGGAYASVDMGEIYYLRPRNSPEVTCTGC
jgi:Flp pilus assembly protein TadG